MTTTDYTHTKRLLGLVDTPEKYDQFTKGIKDSIHSVEPEFAKMRQQVINEIPSEHRHFMSMPKKEFDLKIHGLPHDEAKHVYAARKMLDSLDGMTSTMSKQLSEMVTKVTASGDKVHKIALAHKGEITPEVHKAVQMEYAKVNTQLNSLEDMTSKNVDKITAHMDDLHANADAHYTKVKDAHVKAGGTVHGSHTPAAPTHSAAPASASTHSAAPASAPTHSAAPSSAPTHSAAQTAVKKTHGRLKTALVGLGIAAGVATPVAAYWHSRSKRKTK
jgi:TolA-binding protein